MNKVWMLTYGGEGIPTEVILFREDHPPSTERIREWFYKTLTYGNSENLSLGDKRYYNEKSLEMAEAISNKSYWSHESGYESADLSLVGVE